MDFIAGIKISHADELREAGFDTTALAGTFIQAVIKQVLIDGFFHGDPHPGNLMADPSTKRLVFLDMGLVGQLNSTQRVDLLGLIYAVKEIDIPAIADGLLALGTPMKGFDEVQFRADIDRLARRYLVYGGVQSMGGALTGFMSAVFDNGLRLDSSLTLAIKATVQAEETARNLSPDVDVAAAAITEAKAAFLEQLEPEKLTRQLQSTGVRLSQGARPPRPDPGSGGVQVARRRQPRRADGRARHEGPQRVDRPDRGNGPPGDRSGSSSSAS